VCFWMHSVGDDTRKTKRGRWNPAPRADCWQYRFSGKFFLGAHLCDLSSVVGRPASRVCNQNRERTRQLAREFISLAEGSLLLAPLVTRQSAWDKLTTEGRGDGGLERTERPKVGPSTLEVR